MPKVFTSKTQKIGEMGENIACRFLMKHGFSIKERNYTRKWGEIDIVAEKDSKIYFVEVKSVSCENLENVTPAGMTVQSGRQETNNYRPEDNMHPWKIKRLSRTVETYLLDKNISDNIAWQFDLVCVFIDQKKREAKVKRIKNIIL